MLLTPILTTEFFGVSGGTAKTQEANKIKGDLGLYPH